jgi:4'-phosphopantetheinyl transferase
LRKILGSYLKAHPREIAFRYGKNGKPELLQPHQSPTLHFNLAHSADLAVLAVASFGPVGVDIERVRPIGELDGIAAQFFSQDEKDGLAALPDEERQAAFYRLWTRKEAFLKATGEGIADSLAEVEINFSPTEPARLLRLFGDTVTARHWTILELDPAPNFIGALAVQARDLQIKRWRWIEP